MEKADSASVNSNDFSDIVIHLIGSLKIDEPLALVDWLTMNITLPLIVALTCLASSSAHTEPRMERERSAPGGDRAPDVKDSASRARVRASSLSDTKIKIKNRRYCRRLASNLSLLGMSTYE